MKYIVSLTSHGNRVKYIPSALNEILKDNTDYKIVLTLFEEDQRYITQDLNKLIKDGLIELIVSKTDLGPHLKYFEVMKKYREFPIITIDDDCFINHNRLNLLYNSYLDNPKVINALRVHRIWHINGQILPYGRWTMEYKNTTEPSHYLFPTGVGGVIYPPDIFKINDSFIPEIIKCKYADDIYLKVLEIRRGIKARWIKNSQVHPSKICSQEVTQMALMNVNNKGRNDTYINIFKNEFNKILRL